VPALLDEIQAGMLQSARERLEAGTVDVTSVEEAAEAAQTGFVRIGWDTLGGEEGETRLAESSVSVRCLQRPDGVLPLNGDEPDLHAIVARAY
jgi:prolyl-tRNA synthetase